MEKLGQAEDSFGLQENYEFDVQIKLQIEQVGLQ